MAWDGMGWHGVQVVEEIDVPVLPCGSLEYITSLLALKSYPPPRLTSIISLDILHGSSGLLVDSLALEL